MSAAAAAKAAPDAPPALDSTLTRRGKKKMLMMIMIAGALAVLLAAGGGTFYLMKKRAAAAAAAEEGGDADAADDKAHDQLVKADLKHAPTFVALDPFTVNLADREAERYAQVGMTLELVDAKAGDLLKAYMPAIRNNILLVLAGKTAAQLIDHDGKLQLAAEIRAAALKPLGYLVRVPQAAASGAAAKPPAPATEDEELAPIRAVHFSNFIIQ
jgi:flagellar FliL protein